jgi:hypothetical protein
MDGAGDSTSAHSVLRAHVDRQISTAGLICIRHSDECSVGLLQETAAVKAADLSDHERQAKLLDLCRKVVTTATAPDAVCKVECKSEHSTQAMHHPCRR